MQPLHLAKPHLLIVTGIPGSGKSAFSEKFSSTFGAPVVSDVALKQADEAVTKAIREAATSYQLEQLMLTKTTVIIDSNTATKKQRSNYIVQARKAGYQPLVVWVQTDDATAKQRATRRRQSSGHRYSEEEFMTERQRFSPPAKTEPVVVISGKHTYASQARVVLGVLASDRPSNKLNTLASRVGLSRTSTR